MERIEEKYNIVPSVDGKNNISVILPVLIPRFADWGKSGFTEWGLLHRGSPVREYQLEHPSLETLSIFGGFKDPVTERFCRMIKILPIENSPVSTYELHLFPRNIIKLNSVTPIQII